jgi:mRNA-degrading endonuclease RelE of RelBE toxin-antitoxin system
MEDKSWQILIEDFAKIDLQQAFNWYELEKNGLGNLFLDDFEETLEKIKRNPFYTSKINERTRGASFKKFPYEIVYMVNSEKYIIYIIVITHQHRKPNWYKERK